MKLKLLGLLVIGQTAWATAIPVCTVANAIQSLTPGASYSLQKDDFSTLQWFDTVQSAPTLAQVNVAIGTCLQTQQADVNDFSAILSSLTLADQNWPSLTAGQKDSVLRALNHLVVKKGLAKQQ